MLSMLYRAPPILQKKTKQQQKKHRLSSLHHHLINYDVPGWKLQILIDGEYNSTVITYPADKSREAIPTLSPRAWGKIKTR